MRNINQRAADHVLPQVLEIFPLRKSKANVVVWRLQEHCGGEVRRSLSALMTPFVSLALSHIVYVCVCRYRCDCTSAASGGIINRILWKFIVSRRAVENLYIPSILLKTKNLYFVPIALKHIFLCVRLCSFPPRWTTHTHTHADAFHLQKDNFVLAEYSFYSHYSLFRLFVVMLCFFFT